MAIRQLGECELFNLKMGRADQMAVSNAVRGQLNQNVGDIAPQQIELELTQLRSKTKNSFLPLLPDAFALYEGRGLVRLFNLGTRNTGKSVIPTFMPFILGYGRNRVKESNAEIDAQDALDKVVFINMYRIGNWSADGSTYNNLAAASDLYSCLETGVIMYKMLAQGMVNKVFNNKSVVENLTRIYANMMAQVIVRTKVSFGTEDFQIDCAYFIIAKFFLKYVLKKTEEDAVSSYAMTCIKNRSSQAALEAFEEASEIDYSTLSGFLKTFGNAFFHEPIFVIEFDDQWMKMFGECTTFAIEYAPYLLHFLFAAQHNATLGGTIVKLYKRIGDYRKLGLPKLYASVISEIK